MKTIGSGASKFLERLDVAIESAMFATAADVDSMLAVGLYDTIVRIVTPSEEAKTHPAAEKFGVHRVHAGLLLERRDEAKELANAMCELRAYLQHLQAGNVDDQGNVVFRR
jgi:hypothetical protein